MHRCTMWQQQPHFAAAAVADPGRLGGMEDVHQPHELQHRQPSFDTLQPLQPLQQPARTMRRQSSALSSSSSQASLSMLAGQRSVSLGSVNHTRHSTGHLHQPAAAAHTMVNETFRLNAGPSYFAQAPHQQQAGGNPLLQHPKVNSINMNNMSGVGVNPLLTATQLRTAQAQAHPAAQPAARLFQRPLQPATLSAAALHQHNGGGAGLSASFASAPQIYRQLSHTQQRHPSNLMSLSESDSGSGSGVGVSPGPIPSKQPQAAITGPTQLYRLIAAPRQGEAVDWGAVLQRAKSHPHEACFYDPTAGGHVYALHRLLRRTGGDEEADDDMAGDYPHRPPVEVVEAVMRACPRAVTRKQAVDDDDHADSAGGTNDAGGGMDWQGQPRNNNAAPPNEDGGGDGLGGEGGDEQQRPNPNEDEGDDHAEEVRYEYPLAIACECQQHGEIVRLLASYLSKAKPVYRSEVFRSLDYASLPNTVVRILLEEYAGCVLERGTNSEATEGDDDDCPLEQVLFWWDDPDMLGMEEDIATYPNCNMKDDLCDLYEKLRMMLYAAANGTMVGYDDACESFQVLHHALRIVAEGGVRDVNFPNDFAHAVLLLAKFIERERAMMFEERDEGGSLPLHIAVSGKRLLLPTSGAVEEGKNTVGEEGGADVNDPNNALLQNGGNREAMEQDAEGGLQGDAQLQNNNRDEQQGGPGAGQQAEDGEDDEEDEDEEGYENEDMQNAESTGPSDMEIVKLLLEQHPTSIRLRDSQTGSLPVHLALQHNPRAAEAIEHFLQLYPRSVTMPDGDGRIPLHTALIHESPTWSVVADMAPNTLEARDPTTGLLPFQLAAMSKPEPAMLNGPDANQRDLDSLSTTFRLLRMSPCLAYGLGNVKARPQSLLEKQIMVRYKPRVTKLEEENESLRRRVEQLELELLAVRMGENAMDKDLASSCRPSLKKRKSTIETITTLPRTP